MYLLFKYYFVILNQNGQFKPTFSSLFKKTKNKKKPAHTKSSPHKSCVEDKVFSVSPANV